MSALIPLRLEPPRLVLIGDPQQLPATVLSKVARKFSYGRSLFQRLQACGVGVKMLLMQYRMRPEISAFPAAHFYQNRLRNAPSVLNRPHLQMYNWPNLFRPFLFFDVPSQETRNSSTQSLSNQGEAFFVFSLLRLLVKYFLSSTVRLPVPSSDGKSISSDSRPPEDPNFMTLSDIAIVTPYRQQMIELKRLFESHPAEFPPDQPEVCTIDAFQGREKRVIIFSCVRSSADVMSDRRTSNDNEASSISSSEDDEDETNKEGYDPFKAPVGDVSTLGFVADVRRLNVAVTRARDCLWVVGNMRTLKFDPVWRAMINYSRGKGKIRHERSSEISKTDKSKRAFVDIRVEAHRLQAILKPSHQRRSWNYSNPSILIGAFISLSEEFYLRQDEKRRVLEGRESLSPSNSDTLIDYQSNYSRSSLLSRSISRNTDCITEEPRITEPRLLSRRDRTLSNCSSITSSSSSGDETQRRPSSMNKPINTTTAEGRGSRRIVMMPNSNGPQIRSAAKSKAARSLSTVVVDPKKRPRENSSVHEEQPTGSLKRICRPHSTLAKPPDNPVVVPTTPITPLRPPVHNPMHFNNNHPSTILPDHHPVRMPSCRPKRALEVSPAISRPLVRSAVAKIVPRPVVPTRHEVFITHNPRPIQQTTQQQETQQQTPQDAASKRPVRRLLAPGFPSSIRPRQQHAIRPAFSGPGRPSLGIASSWQHRPPK